MLTVDLGWPYVTYLSCNKQWVTYEKLSRVLEEKFWKARNVGCGRVLVHTTRHNAGFGSQFNNMLLGVAEALAANRTFVLGADVLDGGYQCKARQHRHRYHDKSKGSRW